MKCVEAHQIQEIVDALEQGAVIVFPTETSYGIGCDATNSKTVERVIETKQREANKGLPVLLPSIESIDKYIIVPPKAEMLIEKYWPGPLNIVAEVRDDSPISTWCTKGGMQAGRVSSHPFIMELMKTFKKPLVATSANISGDGSTYSALNVIKQFEEEDLQPDIIVDGGDLPENPASTMARFLGENIEVIRFGKIIF